MATIWEVYYNNMSIDDIKKINPFANKDWLGNGDNLTDNRKRHIHNLFDNEDYVSPERIKAKGRNEGKYAAFRAIVHGYAYPDYNGGLLKSKTGQNEKYRNSFQYENREETRNKENKKSHKYSDPKVYDNKYDLLTRYLNIFDLEELPYDMKDLKKTYKELCIIWHPDKNPERVKQRVTEKLKQINEAYIWLCRYYEK